MADDDTAALAAGIRRRDRRSLARAITLVESTRPDHRDRALALLDEVLGDTGGAVRVGITGPPGVGKSTLIEALGLHLRTLGLGLAVLAIDPSSGRSGGSILGDKTRMGELAGDPGVFIRPSPGGGHLGGVARRTREAMLLCEAAGHDVVIVETVGVGQSETEVADMVDVFVLLVPPGGGDELQGIKRGIMELADVVVVNKADGDLAPAAGRTCADYRAATHLLAPRWRSWQTEALTASALRHEGIVELWDAVERFRETIGSTGELAGHRAIQAVRWMWHEVREALWATFEALDDVQGLVMDLEADVAASRLSATSGARRLLEAAQLGGANPPSSGS